MERNVKKHLGNNTKRYLSDLIDDLKAEDNKAANKSTVVKAKLAKTTLFAGKLTESTAMETSEENGQKDSEHVDKKKIEMSEEEKNKLKTVTKRTNKEQVGK